MTNKHVVKLAEKQLPVLEKVASREEGKKVASLIVSDSTIEDSTSEISFVDQNDKPVYTGRKTAFRKGKIAELVNEDTFASYEQGESVETSIAFHKDSLAKDQESKSKFEETEFTSITVDEVSQVVSKSSIFGFSAMAIVLVAAIGGAAYYYFRGRKQN